MDGQPHGATPLSLAVDPGDHRVTLRLDGYAETTYRVSVSAGATGSIQGELWLQTPTVERLRPIFPGSTVVGATFLTDGRVALVLALPSSDERQIWAIRDGESPARLSLAGARRSVVPSPDGQRVAYLASSRQSGEIASDRLDEIWIAGQPEDRGERR